VSKRVLMDRFEEFSEPEQLAVAASLAAGLTHLARVGSLDRARTHQLFALNDALGDAEPDLDRIERRLREVLAP
jgi:hypothetical protein